MTIELSKEVHTKPSFDQVVLPRTHGREDTANGGSGVGALLSPTAQQLLDGVKVMGGRERFGQLALKSMPANALYASAFKGGGTPDPMFAD